MTAFMNLSPGAKHSIHAPASPRKQFSIPLANRYLSTYNSVYIWKGNLVLDTTAVPAIFLHNFIAVIATLLLSIPIRIRWLITLIAWGLAIGLSFLWEQVGLTWHFTWKTYFYNPIFGGGLWHDSASDAEVFGLFLFWLMPLALAYLVALARIARIER
jgi:hypothetical protein